MKRFLAILLTGVIITAQPFTTTFFAAESLSQNTLESTDETADLTGNVSENELSENRIIDTEPNEDSEENPVPDDENKKEATDKNNQLLDTNYTVSDDCIDAEIITISNEDKYDGEDEIFSYSVNDDGKSVTITGLKDGVWQTFEPVIPSEIDGKSVTTIKEGAFNCERYIFGTLIIPGSVKTIGKDAFLNCSGLTGVTINEGVEVIGAGAFYDCSSIKSLIIPSSVRSIDEDAFRYCSGLESLVIENGVSEIGDSAFYECNSLNKDITIPGSVKRIGEGAFWGCGLSGTLTVEEGVQLICSGAFRDSGFEVVKLPDTVTEIGSGAFEFRNRSDLINSNLKIISLPSGIKKINNYTFSGCSNLRSIIIPNSVTEIGKGAFDNCRSIVNLVIPSKVENIGGWAFADCSGLTDLIIPSNVKAIGEWAFCDCSSIKRLIISDGVEEIGDGAFFKCTGISCLTIPGSVKSIKEDAFYKCNGLKSLTIKQGVPMIGKGAFEDCANLSSLSLPGSLKTIGDSSFRDCIRLKGCLSLPNGLTVLENGAFYGCTGITSISFPSSIRTIGPSAFYNCTGLKGMLTLPNGVKTIKSGAFGVEKGSSAISGTLTIPSSVTTLEDGAFRFYRINKIINNSNVSIRVSNFIESGSKDCFINNEGRKAALTGCVEIGKGTWTRNGKSAAVTSVKLNKKSASVVKGYSVTLKATVVPANASNKKVTWKTSDKKVATVTNQGVVKGIKKGTATITASTVNGKKATCKITVNNPVAVKGVKLNKTKATVGKGQKLTLKATVNPSNATNKKIKWKSSNTKIATVNSTGIVTGVKAGKVNITAITVSGKKEATCAVTVTYVPVKKIALNKTSASIDEGQTLLLKATISPSNATNKGINWSSSNTKVASVKSNGSIKGLRPGNITITATSKDGGKKAVCNLTVKGMIPAEGVKLNKTEITLYKGRTEALKATMIPADATNKKIHWMSFDNNVATVNSAGKVTGTGNGDTVISATTDDGGFVATCKVYVTDDIPAEGITLDRTSASIAKGGTLTLRASILPSDAKNKNISWKSSDESVATVSQAGRISGKGVGSAVITVTTEDGSKIATCNITVAPPYNVAEAQKFALKHCMDSNQWECAEFVSRSMRAGGLDIPVVTWVDDLTSSLKSTGGFGLKPYKLRIKGDEVYSNGDNEGKVSVGDPIVFRITSGDYKGVDLHYAIVTGLEDNIVHISQKNSSLKNSRYLGTFVRDYKGKRYSCKNGTLAIYVWHYNGST